MCHFLCHRILMCSHLQAWEIPGIWGEQWLGSQVLPRTEKHWPAQHEPALQAFISNGSLQCVRGLSPGEGNGAEEGRGTIEKGWVLFPSRSYQIPSHGIGQLQVQKGPLEIF